MAVYWVRTDSWYVERAVWLAAGVVATTGTAAALVFPPAIALAGAVGVFSMGVAFTGLCPASSLMATLGLKPRLGVASRLGPFRVYHMRLDRWYLERRIYLAVGFNVTLASVLALVHSQWWLLFTGFVGVAAIFFSMSGFCVMANLFYRLGAEPRLGAVAPGVARPSSASTAAG